jgi:hypothetical protein
MGFSERSDYAWQLYQETKRVSLPHHHSSCLFKVMVKVKNVISQKSIL